MQLTFRSKANKTTNSLGFGCLSACSQRVLTTMDRGFPSHQHFLSLLHGMVFLVGFLRCMETWKGNLRQRIWGWGGRSEQGTFLYNNCLFPSIYERLVCEVTRGKLCLVICGGREEEKGWEGQVLWQMAPHELNGAGFFWKQVPFFLTFISELPGF